MPEGKVLEVHCISNHQYARLKGVSTTNSVNMGAEATGIPGLRAYSLSLPAPAAMSNLESYMNHVRPAFLNGLLLWTQRTPVKNHERFLDVVQAPQTACNSCKMTYAGCYHLPEARQHLRCLQNVGGD